MAWSKNMIWSKFYDIPENLSEIYLKKLKIEKQEPSRKFLDKLILANLTTIPFENLNTTDFNLPVSIEPNKLVEKILYNNRGGYCFELNGLFCMLLVSLGFNAYMCPCRQMRHSESSPVPATHCGILVYLDDEILFCDVGYGGPVPRGSIEFKADILQKIDSEIFYLKKSGITPNDKFSDFNSGWYSLVRKSQKTNKDLVVMQIAPIQFYLCDFYGQNLLRSVGDTSYSVRHVAIMLENGFVDLTGDVLTIKQDDIIKKKIINDEELLPVLKKYFNIEKNK